MSTEYSDVHKGKPDHIDLTAHHTREPDILGKYQILYCSSMHSRSFVRLSNPMGLIVIDGLFLFLFSLRNPQNPKG
jgi:hypothetical protein